MYQYFKMLEDSIRNCSITYNSIKDLTIDLAYSGGYYRGIYEFKNGNKRERTLYTKAFAEATSGATSYHSGVVNSASVTVLKVIPYRLASFSNDSLNTM